MQRAKVSFFRKAFLLLLSAFVLSGGLGADVSIKIWVAQAHAREQPRSGARSLAVLSHGAVYSVVQDVPYWYGIRLPDGRAAYVAKSLCRVILEEEPAEPEETDPSLNDLYAVPAAGPPVTLPDCTPRRAAAGRTGWPTCRRIAIRSPVLTRA